MGNPRRLARDWLLWFCLIGWAMPATAQTLSLARLDAALAETRIVGLSTNVQFLRHVVASPSFAQANLDTALIPREAGVLFNQDKVGLNLAVAAAVAQTLLAERASEGKDPFSRRDGWRPHGLTVRRFDFEYLGEAMQASLTYLHDGALQLAFGETAGVLAFGFAIRDVIVEARPFRLKREPGHLNIVVGWTRAQRP